MKSIYLPILFGLLALPALAEKKEKESVPDVSLSDVRWGEVVNDVEFDKKALEGKVVVIEKWGVKCGPCVASLPDMAKMAKRGTKKGLVVVGMEVQNSSKDEINALLKKARVKYPVVSGGNVPVSTGGIPHASVFDHTGKLLWHGNPHADEFEDAVKDALKAVPKA